MRLLPEAFLRPAAKVIFAPADRFFVRVVSLAPDLDPASQVELALESMAPFPPSQLYWGCWVAPDRTVAVVYAAHRRRFTAEETADWEKADWVVPGLLPLLGTAPGQNVVRLWNDGARLVGVAWNGTSAYPAAVLARPLSEDAPDDVGRQLAGELRARAGLATEPRIESVAGAPRMNHERAGLSFELGDAAGAMVVQAQVSAADGDLLDVRDQAFLAEQRRQRRRAAVIWRAFLACGGLAAAALLLDVGALGLSRVAQAQQAVNEARAQLVTRLETANGLANRLEELTERRLRFFEMLDAVNRPRPGSILFTRVASSGRTGLEIEAQTGAAGDIGAYESELRLLPNIGSIEVRDLRAREGVTTFGMVLAFKDEGGPGGAP